MSTGSEIIDDKREIRTLMFDNEDGEEHKADERTKIEAYGEPGMHCDLPFFKVIRDGVVMARIPATHVSVYYKT